MNQQQLERSLKPSLAHALDIIRENPSINRYQAEQMGHGSLTQRVSDLEALGFMFAHEYKPFKDARGNERLRVAHYTFLGWKAPAAAA